MLLRAAVRWSFCNRVLCAFLLPTARSSFAPAVRQLCHGYACHCCSPRGFWFCGYLYRRYVHALRAFVNRTEPPAVPPACRFCHYSYHAIGSYRHPHATVPATTARTCLFCAARRLLLRSRRLPATPHLHTTCLPFCTCTCTDAPLLLFRLLAAFCCSHARSFYCRGWVLHTTFSARGSWFFLLSVYCWFFSLPFPAYGLRFALLGLFSLPAVYLPPPPPYTQPYLLHAARFRRTVHHSSLPMVVYSWFTFYIYYGSG